MNEREFKNRNELNLRTINNLKSDIDALKQELNVLSADAQDLRFDNQSINEIVNNRSSEIAQLKAELGDLSDNNSHLAMEKKDLETQIHRVRTENREHNLELEETNHQIGEATERRNKFERLIRELEYENERLEKTNEDLQRQQDGLRLEIRNKVDNTKYNEQLYSENRKQIIALEADLNDLRRINEKTKNEIATHNKNQQVEQSKNLEAQSRINKLDALIKERDYEVSTLRGEYDELKRDQVKLLDTNDDLNHDIDACSRHLDLLTLQNSEVKDILLIFIINPSPSYFKNLKDSTIKIKKLDKFWTERIRLKKSRRDTKERWDLLSMLWAPLSEAPLEPRNNNTNKKRSHDRRFIELMQKRLILCFEHFYDFFSTKCSKVQNKIKIIFIHMLSF